LKTIIVPVPSFPDITSTPSSPSTAATVSASPAPPKVMITETSSNPTASIKPEFKFTGHSYNTIMLTD
jgi:hypothetical protein